MRRRAIRQTIGPHQIWSEVKHEAGFRQPGVESLAALWFGNQGSRLVQPAPQEARKHGQIGMALANLARRDLEQANLPPMAIHQHQPAESAAGQLRAHHPH